MAWTKLTNPYRANLIGDVDLIIDEKIIASASKDNPVPGMVTHYGTKKSEKTRYACTYLVRMLPLTNAGRLARNA